MLDVGISGLLLAMFCPLMVVVWLVVRWKMGRPAIFRQQRPGRHARPFVLYKFRTMSDARDPHGALLPDAERLTPLGKFLRRASLDELPQLWNVLRGEMSLVGPRPLPLDYVARYTPREATRLRVRPGLCGLAQSMGRNAVPWDERLEWDARYAARVTLAGDFAILLRCARVLWRGEGVSAPGHATMPELRTSGSRADP